MQNLMRAAAIERLPYRPCVGLLILNRQGEIFAGQRLDSQMDAWQMPQGGIDPGETPFEAAVRELREETGIDPVEVELLRESTVWRPYDLPHHLVPKLWGGQFRGQRQRWFAMRYGGEDDGIDIATEEPEFRAWAWMAPDRLIDCIVPFKRDIYSAVFEEFRDLF